MLTNAILKLIDKLNPTDKPHGKVVGCVVYQLKLWLFCFKMLKKNKHSQQAAALAYHTIFGLIPLAIVMLIIFQSIPNSGNVGADFKELIYENIQLDQFQYPDPKNPEETIMLTKYVDDFIANFFRQTNKGAAALISVVLVVWAALKLLTTIERTFNNTWNILHGRSLLQRVFSYWTPLTLGPLLIGAGITISTHALIKGVVGSGGAELVRPIMPYMISVFVFFLLYWFIPHTKVNPLYALWGAAVAALIWTLVKWAFGYYVTRPSSYSQIYGVLSLVPLTVLWIYITWLIILFGVQLTYVMQNFRKLDQAEIIAAQKDENFYIASEMTVINIMRYICLEYEKGHGPIQVRDVCLSMNLPNKFTQSVLEHLVNQRLLFVTNEPHEGFVPSNKSANISLGDVATAVKSQKLEGEKNFLPNIKLSTLKNSYIQELSNLKVSEVIDERGENS